MHARSVRVLALALTVASSLGCEREPGPRPVDVCNWMDECFGDQPGCEKALIPTYEDAAEEGCSAELAESFACLIEQECNFDGTECLDESEAYNDCVGLAF